MNRTSISDSLFFTRSVSHWNNNLLNFRCDIPVVIMGETGCGKTRLIQFMCQLQCSDVKNVQNMFVMKVHVYWNTNSLKKKHKIFKKFARLFHPFKVFFLLCRSMEELQRKISLEKSRKLNLQPDKISREKRQNMFILYSFLMKQTQLKQSGLSRRSCVIKQSAEDL